LTLVGVTSRIREEEEISAGKGGGAPIPFYEDREKGGGTTMFFQTMHHQETKEGSRKAFSLKGEGGRGGPSLII